MKRLEKRLFERGLLQTRLMGVTFYGAIVKAWPVDTGLSRNGWVFSNTPTGINVSNAVDYSKYLWYGIPPNEMMYHGSKQMPHGGRKILDEVMKGYGKW